MAVKAVIFDLFGTLIHDKFLSLTYPAFLSRMAASLSLKNEEFEPLWQGSYLDRTTGKYPTLQDNVRWIGEKLGRTFESSAVENAAAQIVEVTRQSFLPRRQALDVLNQIKRMGLKTGLISDCGPAVPLIWNETPFAGLFDATAFSCKECLKKPDPKFFKVILDRLDVQAKDCFYVGDGNSGELQGAKALGMKTALIWGLIDPEEPERLVLKDWEGVTLVSLTEVVDLLT